MVSVTSVFWRWHTFILFLRTETSLKKKSVVLEGMELVTFALLCTFYRVLHRILLYVTHSESCYHYASSSRNNSLFCSFLFFFLVSPSGFLICKNNTALATVPSSAATVCPQPFINSQDYNSFELTNTAKLAITGKLAEVGPTILRLTGGRKSTLLKEWNVCYLFQSFYLNINYQLSKLLPKDHIHDLFK